MRLLLFLFFVVLLNVSSTAQVRIGITEIGYQTHFMQSEGADFVVDRYNETRSFLTEEMRRFSYLDGLTFGSGIAFGVNAPFVEMGINFRGQTRFSEGTVSGVDFRRELRMKNHTFFLGLGLLLGNDNFIIIPGVRGEIGKLKYRTRIDETDNIKSADWDEIHNEFSSYLSFYLKIPIGLVVIEPYYSLDLIGEDVQFGLEDVNEAINPNTFQNDPDPLPFNGGGFGIRLVFGTANLR